MVFEKAYDIKVSKMEDFDKELQKYLDPELSEEQLERFASTQNHRGDVIVRDENERRRRAEVSKKMRESMIGFLRNKAKAFIERNKTERKALDRPLAYDTTLLLPHEEQNEEYERRYNILVSGTAKEKRKLLFDTLHEVQKGYTPEKLMALTDEEIAADFENLHLLKQYAVTCGGLSKKEELELSEDDKKELLDFEEKFATPAAAVFNRAKMVSAPYYELIRPEKFGATAFREANEALDDVVRDGEEMQSHSLAVNISSYVDYSLIMPSKEFIKNQGIEGYGISEVTWMTQDGVQILKRNPQGEIIPFDGVPVEEITNGKSLIAVLPNGKMREFSTAVDEGGRINFNVKERSLLAHMDRHLPGEVADLSESLEQVDHWYIRSSPEFRNIKNCLETIQKEWKELGLRPTEYQRDKLRRQMEALSDNCSKYIDKKNQKKDLNDTDWERLEVIKKVSEFAGKQLKFCSGLDNLAKEQENHIVFEEQLDSVMNENERQVLTDNAAEFTDTFLAEVQNSIKELKNADKGMFTGSSHYEYMQNKLSKMAEKIEDMGDGITWDSVEELSGAFNELKVSTEFYLQYKSNPKNCSGSDREKQRIAAAEKLKKLCDNMQPRMEEMQKAMERPEKERVKLRVAEVVNEKYSSQESSKEMQQLCNNIRNNDAYARYIDNPKDKAVKDTVIRHMAEMVAVEHLGILKKRKHLEESKRENALLESVVPKSTNAEKIIAEVGVDKYVDMIMKQKDFKEAVENLEPHKMCSFIYGNTANDLALKFDKQILKIAQEKKQQNSIADKEVVNQKQAEAEVSGPIA